MMTSQELVDLVMAKARYLIEEQGVDNLPPAAFLAGDDDSLAIIGMPWEDQRHKMFLMNALRFALEGQDSVKLCAILSEAWAVQVQKGESGDGVLPSQDPRRVSVVIISVESRDGESFTIRSEIKETEGGRRTVGEPDRMENVGGALTDVFGTRKRRAH